ARTASGPIRRGDWARGRAACGRCYGMAALAAMGRCVPRSEQAPARGRGLQRAEVQGGDDLALFLFSSCSLVRHRAIWCLLNHLSVQVDIQAFDLDRLADPDTRQYVGDDEDHEGGDRGPYDGGGDTFELDQHLTRVTFQQARCPAYRLQGEHTGQHGTDASYS